MNISEIYGFDVGRDAAGVRKRHDDKGDAWALAHRNGLGRPYHMHDIDALFGLEVFGANTGERLFLEYVPDDYKNKTHEIREFAVIAMFDRKTTESAAFCEYNTLSRAIYLWQCRTFATQQPIPPRFFLVIGGQNPPWRLIELDIQTGERIGGSVEVTGERFKEVWEAIGLTNLRNELRRFILDPKG